MEVLNLRAPVRPRRSSSNTSSLKRPPPPSSSLSLSPRFRTGISNTRMVCSTAYRPFTILVKNNTFTVDADKLGRMSPIFYALMCYGREMEIVDEGVKEISEFLQCLQSPDKINQWNFVTTLRLASKYEVPFITEACENYIIKADLGSVKADQILTLLLAAHEEQMKREVIAKLVLRLAAEDSSTFTRLKLSRFLPAQLYGNVISTSLNLKQLKEYEQMNGHAMHTERARIQCRRSLCEMCKRIASETAHCDGCGLTLCRQHWTENRCKSTYGQRMLDELRRNTVDLNYE